MCVKCVATLGGLLIFVIAFVFAIERHLNWENYWNKSRGFTTSEYRKSSRLFKHSIYKKTSESQLIQLISASPTITTQPSSPRERFIRPRTAPSIDARPALRPTPNTAHYPHTTQTPRRSALQMCAVCVYKIPDCRTFATTQNFFSDSREDYVFDYYYTAIREL